MFGWIKALSMGQKIGGGVLLLLLFVGAIALGKHFIDTAFDSAEEKGVIQERATTNAEGMESVEKANAVDNSRDDEFDNRVRDEFCRDCPTGD